MIRDERSDFVMSVRKGKKTLCEDKYVYVIGKGNDFWIPQIIYTRRRKDWGRRTRR